MFSMHCSQNINNLHNLHKMHSLYFNICVSGDYFAYISDLKAKSNSIRRWRVFSKHKAITCCTRQRNGQFLVTKTDSKNVTRVIDWGQANMKANGNRRCIRKKIPIG